MKPGALVISHNYIRFAGDHAGLFVHTLNKSLEKTGFDITVVAPHDPGSMKSDHIDDIHIRRFRYGPNSMEKIAYRGTMHELVRGSLRGMLVFSIFMLAFVSKVAVEAVRVRPDLLHAHWWFPGGFLAYLISVITGIPYVVTIHGTDAQIAGNNYLLRNLCRKVLFRAQAVMVSSDYLISILKKHLSDGSFNQLRLFKIPVPVEPFHEPRGTVKGDIDPNTILTIGRLTEQKNIGVLIEALVHLRDEGIPYRAVIIGDGPLRNEIELMISHGGIGDRVTLKTATGRKELEEHFGTCGIFVLPSVREGLGLVLVEALLMKRPVAASRSGGATEIVEDGVTGLLFDPGDPGELADVLKKLLHNRELANELAARGFERVRSRFSPMNVAEQQAEIYRAVLGMKSHAARGESVGSGKGEL